MTDQDGDGCVRFSHGFNNVDLNQKPHISLLFITILHTTIPIPLIHSSPATRHGHWRRSRTRHRVPSTAGMTRNRHITSTTLARRPDLGDGRRGPVTPLAENHLGVPPCARAVD